MTQDEKLRPRPAAASPSMLTETVLYAVARTAPSLTAMVLTLILVRSLDLEGYGRFAVYWSVSAIAITVSGGWHRQWVLKNPDSTGYGLVCTPAVRGMYLAAPSLFIPACWVLLGGSPWEAAAAYLFSISALYHSVGQTVLQAQGRVRRIVAGEVFRNGAVLLGLWGLISAGASDVASVLTLMAACAWISHRYHLHGMDVSAQADDALSGAWKFGWPISAWLGLAALLQFSDRLVIEWLTSSTQTGLYSSLYDVLNRGTGFLVMPITMALHPRYMRLMNRREEVGAQRLLRRSKIVQAGIGLVVSAMVLILASQIANAIVGDEVPNAPSVVLPLTAGGFLWHFSQIAHKPLEAGGRTRAMLICIAACVLLNFVLNLLLIPIFGYAAAAWTTLGASILYLGLVGIAVRWPRRAGPGVLQP